MTRSEDARERLAEHGEVRPQPTSDWAGSFPLPRALGAFYAEVGPVDVTVENYGNPFFFPSLARLWDLQAGYRWHGLTGDRLPEWHDGWIVVMTTGGDPTIFDVSTERVLFAAHGAGAWEPSECFTDLSTMALCIATLGAIVRDAGEGFMDDDFYVRPEHQERALLELSRILGSRSEAEAIMALAEWG